MTAARGEQGRRPGVGRLARALGLLSLAMVLALAAGVAWIRSVDPAGSLVPAVLSAAVCWLASAAGLLIVGSIAPGPRAVAGALASMLVGMLLPLATGVTLTTLDPALAAEGLMAWMMAMFLVALAVKSSLVVWLLQPARLPAGGPSPGGA